jgi:sodium ion-translocating decarboxylase beta subunit
MDSFLNIFPGIMSFFQMPTEMAIARVFLIGLGFLILYLGCKDILEPLIMVPMGVGICLVNAGILMMPDLADPAKQKLGTMFLDSMVNTPTEHINALQVYFLQPIYALTFSNGLIACMVFLGIGAITELDFFIGNPKLSLMLAIPAELGTFLTFPIAIAMGFTPKESAAIAVIGGADGPMVLFASLQLAKNLFVPISIISYIYLSIVYSGYPYLIKALVPKKLRGIPMKEMKIIKVSSGEKISFSIVTGTVLSLLFPVAAPLFVSFFLGVIIKESNVTRYVRFADEVILTGATLFLGFLLGCLLSADIVVNPQMFKLIILGFVALFLSGIGGLLGGYLACWLSKGKINPLIGIAGVSCVPSTAKVAHKCANEVNEEAFILPYAMGPNIAGVITTAILTAIYVTKVQFLQ